MNRSLKDILRYSVMVIGLMGLFTQFIACGAELYQISLESDSPQVNLRTPKSVNDPTFGIHASSGWKSLPIYFRTAIDLDTSQIQAIRHAMRTWEWALGKNPGELFAYSGKHEGMVGDKFRDLYSSLRDYVNGHYLDQNWAKTGKDALTIASTIWENEPGSQDVIATADIRYNTQAYALGDSYKLKSSAQRQVVDLESLALHEVGHLIGLEHVPQDIDGFSIMNPRLYVGEGLATRTLSRGDILRIQSIYGCEGLACDVDDLLQSTVEARAPDLTSSAANQVSPPSNQGAFQKQRY